MCIFHNYYSCFLYSIAANLAATALQQLIIVLQHSFYLLYNCKIVDEYILYSFSKCDQNFCTRFTFFNHFTSQMHLIFSEKP